MRGLASLAGRTRRIRWRRYQGHAADRRNVEVEALAGPQPGSLDDLDLGQLIGPAADAVDGLAAKVDPAPDFPDPEFRSSRYRPNLSTCSEPMVFPALMIGACAIVGGGAVVTADCDPRTSCAGVPARQVG